MIRPIAIAAACVALSGCMTGAVQKLTPDQMHVLITDFHNAGCGGSVDVDIGASGTGTGIEAHNRLQLKGSCPVGDVPARPSS